MCPKPKPRKINVLSHEIIIHFVQHLFTYYQKNGKIICYHTRLISIESQPKKIVVVVVVVIGVVIVVVHVVVVVIPIVDPRNIPLKFG